MELKEKGSVGDPGFESGGGGVLGVSVLAEEADCNVVSARFGPSWQAQPWTVLFPARLGSVYFFAFLTLPIRFGLLVKLCCKIIYGWQFNNMNKEI